MRALYRWHVTPGREDQFVRIWSNVTKYIRANVKGARGSMLMRSRLNPQEFVALARWASYDDWMAAREAAERNPGPDPQAGNYDSFSAEPLDVIEDLLQYGE
jgi:heme-degrading monooxygenase HmoA